MPGINQNNLRAVIVAAVTFSAVVGVWADAALEFSAISSGGSVLSDGNILVVGQATIGFSEDATHTLHAGIVPCLGSGVPGDYDGDGDVDLDDFAVFAECLFGPEVAPGPAPPPTPGECLAAFDFDSDEDVDAADFAEFQVAFGGG